MSMDGYPKQSVENSALLISVLFFAIAGVYNICGVVGKSQTQALPAIEQRINPNSAELGSLVRLHNIGLTRAQKIIDYRTGDKFTQVGDAFKSPKDLENIKGIGPKTVVANTENLKFE